MVKKSRKLHLGCGLDIRKGWVNVDIAPLKGVDVVMDLEKFPYPFKDNSFDEVETVHVLEHLEDLIKVMEELHRICAPGAEIRIMVPYFASPSYWLDPTHKRMFNIDSFVYFSGKSYLTKAHFTVLKRKLMFFSSQRHMVSSVHSIPIDLLINLAQPIYQRFFVYLLPASEVHFTLRVEKRN